MAIPRAVREAGERAEALHQQMYGNTGEQPTPEQTAAPVVDAPPPQVQDVQPVATTPQAEAPAQPSGEENWEVKYKVLNGKYSAEVPRLAEQVRELKDQIKALSEKPAPEPEVVVKNKLTPEQVVEQFGEDFASAVGSLASQIAEQRTAKLREELAPKVEQAAETAIRSARADFFRGLEALVPEFRQIDEEDGFTLFLDEVDPMSGRPRRDFFNDANHSNDAARVARFFSAYRGLKSQPAQQPVAMPSIEAQIAPDSSRSAPSTPPGKKLWTRAEIGRFYEAVRRGAYSEQDYGRIESDIFAAQRENRVAA